MTRTTDRTHGRQRIGKLKFFVFASLPTVLVVILAEAVLQWVGFPYAPETLLRPHFVAAEKGWMVTRPLFTRLETEAHPQRIPVTKAAGVFRIALLGGSSVKLLGDAEYLAEWVGRSIGRDVQILNFALCGCGSDRALVSAGQALQLDVDAILLYSGHNEFISESNRKTYRQPGWARAHSKILQLCTGNPWKPEPGRLHNPAESQEVYARFRENLRQLSVKCREAGVVLVWGSVASNLRIPPVIYGRDSYKKEALPPEPLLEFQRGKKLFYEQRYQEARNALQRAIAGSPRPSRATWQNNAVLREEAKALSVPLADVEQRVAAAAQHAIPGKDLFSDHCHLNDRGNVILLETFGETLVRELQRTAE